MNNADHPFQIIPIEGDFAYNSEKQSSFSDILPEMVVSRELSMLGDDEKRLPNFTKNFLQIYRYLNNFWMYFYKKSCTRKHGLYIYVGWVSVMDNSHRISLTSGISLTGNTHLKMTGLVSCEMSRNRTNHIPIITCRCIPGQPTLCCICS